MSALIPIDDGLWQVPNDVFMPGGIHFPGRMVVVRLSGGGVLLHSVVPIDDALATDIARIGRVAHIVAPNGFHHLFVAAAAARYPDAEVHGVPILAAQKRKDVTFDTILDDSPHPAWRDDLDQRVIAGVPKIHEVAFYHRATGTLILTDLIFNLQEVANRRTRWLLKLMRAWGRPAQSRMWRWATKDRAAAAESVEAVLSWDLRRVVMAHGTILEREPGQGADERQPAAELRDALGWMLGGRSLATRRLTPVAGAD